MQLMSDTSHLFWQIYLAGIDSHYQMFPQDFLFYSLYFKFLIAWKYINNVYINNI